MQIDQLIPTDEYYVNNMKKSRLFYSDELGFSNDEQADYFIKMVPKSVAAKYSVFPILMDQDTLVMATNKPQSFKEQKFIERDLKKKVKLLLAENENVEAALLKYYEVNASAYQRSHGKDFSEIDSGPLKKAILDMIREAEKRGASDVHLLPYEEGMFVHFRINGHLLNFTQEYNFQPEESLTISTIIKNMDESGQADAVNQNMPGQGAFKSSYEDVPIDIRMSTVPISYGDGLQKVNLRFLPQSQKRVILSGLGYRPEELAAIKAMLLKSSTGVIILSGPTGSGKTTTIYALIYEDIEMFGEDKIVYTIENPVEIREPRFCQVQVREAKEESLSLTAPKILDTGMRQDPDDILYGEIRTKTDAEVAVNAAQTGHKVFATVHAKDCIATISRLLGLGVERASLLREINMIMNQRLIGVLCENCCQPHTLTDMEKAVLNQEELDLLKNAKLREKGSLDRIKSCTCRGGYKTRIPVLEYVTFDMELRDALLKDNVRFADIKSLLEKRNFKSMWEKGLELVAAGVTDLNEVLRYIGKPE